MPGVALLTIHEFTAAVVAVGKYALYSAATPATYADVYDVPLPPGLLPGAYRSTQLPQVVNAELASAMVDAATVSPP